jgi:repressor LexA
MRSLTERQEEIYTYLLEYLDERGYPPSIRDIMRAFGFKSPKAAADHLAALERKGFIRRAPELSRAIEVPARNAAIAAARNGARGLLGAYDPSATSTLAGRGLAHAVEVPLVGRIAAGEPLLAVENIEDVLTLDGSLLPADGSFLLRVVGDSMIGAHIVEGDYILVKPQESADPGEIVVALIGGEATVKRLFPEGERVRLQPENPRHKPILVARDSDDFRVVGRVVGVVRRLP